MPQISNRPSRHRRAAVAATFGAVLALTLAGAATAAPLQQPYANPVYVPPIPGQNLSPPAPRQNLSPPPPPTTRPAEGDSSTRIQGGSTRRMPLPGPQQGQ